MLNMLMIVVLVSAGDAPAKSAVDKSQRWAHGTETTRDDLFASPLRLCVSAQVREAVKITPKQWEELNRLKAVRQKDAQNLNLPIATLEETVSSPIFRQARDENRLREARDLRRVLDAKQVRRLTQIYLQVFEVFALADPEFAEMFNLSPEQRDEIVAIRERYRDFVRNSIAQVATMEQQFFESKANQLPPNTSAEARELWGQQVQEDFLKAKTPDFEQNFSKKDKARAAAIREITRQLTKRQREAFQKAKGEPFELGTMAEPAAVQMAAEAEEKAKADKKK